MTRPAIATIRVGEALPELRIPITTTLVVAGALVSRDFTPVHHDPAAARAQGMTDVFMNILTTNGLVSRFVTDWAGPEATIRRIAVRLGAPNLPGDTMVLQGQVAAVDEAACRVQVEVQGRNGWGDHVTGTVDLELPRGAA